MSRWTHPQCRACWEREQGDRRPVAVINDEEQTCCFCGAPTRAGIYVREDPAVIKDHPEHRE